MKKFVTFSPHQTAGSLFYFLLCDSRFSVFFFCNAQYWSDRLLDTSQGSTTTLHPPSFDDGCMPTNTQAINQQLFGIVDSPTVSSLTLCWQFLLKIVCIFLFCVCPGIFQNYGPLVQWTGSFFFFFFAVSVVS